MWLFLDPRNEDNTINVGILRSRGKPRFFIYDRNKDRSLLGFIEKKLQTTHYSLQTARGLVIIPGPGGFSTVRAAAVLANTLAFAAGIPIGVVKPESGQLLEQIFKQGTTAIKSGKIHTSVVPRYGKPPTITSKLASYKLAS